MTVDIDDLVRESTSAQDVPFHVEDESALAFVAGLIRAKDGEAVA